MSTDHYSHHVAVLGAGVMGTGIAAMAVGHGVAVSLIDIDGDKLDRARAEIAGKIRHAGLLGSLPDGRDHGELTLSDSVRDVAGSTAVIEAITEEPDLKAKVLGTASATIRPGTPMISNTSGIPIDELAGSVQRPEDLLGTHFMNPAYLIRMVEVVRGPRTGEAAMAAARDMLTAMDRTAIVVRDSPGFVTSRLLHPMINTAARLVGDGVADAEAVDTLMRGCLGHPTGPLRTADLIGLDNLVDSLEVLHARTGDDSCRPCPQLVDLVRAGHLGRKSGRGFYDYRGALS
ncbi:3-hydroxyacyl-CoA dehydrogenase family protein [Actinoplanes sp. DH11]|uniref:3-hydroxyacyl-CoA dehydrogenase family protein n=1 Tax=Actinoplanes sp. DH11 TaxID=2857011 RepID=UPI001E57CBCC|nr:3-hydroxyacyl-CoA dehydrogenase family protein [Actinoplanes sp. DH11]